MQIACSFVEVVLIFYITMKYKNALCIYPQRKEISTVGIFPPLGLEHIAAVVKNFSERITIIDMRFEKDALAFVDNTTDLICISINWWHEEKEVKELINSLPMNVTTIVGGRYATENVDEFFRDCPNINIIVRGDGEEIVKDILEGKPLSEITGISYRNNGSVIHNKPRDLSNFMDDIYPDRTLRRYVYKANLQGLDLGIEWDTISSSRGCPFSCKYCDFNSNPLGQKRSWSSRSPESVIDELKKIKARYVGFTDDNLTNDLKRMERLCDLLIEEKIKKTYFINTRLNIAARPDLIEKMYRAGFRVLLIGLESTQDRILKAMQKGFTTAKAKEWAKVLNKYNFFIHGYFIIGNLNEKEEEMMQIPSYARELGVDTLGLSQLRIRRYSPLLNVIKDMPNYHIGAEGKVYSDEYSSDHLRQIRRRVTREFYNVPHILRIIKKLILLRVLTLSLFFKGIKFAINERIERKKKRRKKLDSIKAPA